MPLINHLIVDRPFKWRHGGACRSSLLPEVDFDELLARLAKGGDERQVLTEYIEACNLQAWEDAHFPRCRRPTLFPVTEKTMGDHLDELYPDEPRTATGHNGNTISLRPWSVVLPKNINPQEHIFRDLISIQRSFWKLTVRYDRATHSLRLVLPRRKARLIPKKSQPMSQHHVLLWKMGESYRRIADWVEEMERTGVIMSLDASIDLQQMREIEERVKAARARPDFLEEILARREAEAMDEGMWEIEDESGYYTSDEDY